MKCQGETFAFHGTLPYDTIIQKGSMFSGRELISDAFFRVEYDAYRSDLEYYATTPQTEISLQKQRETEEVFARQKQEFEKLRSDVQIKLKFLDENRVSGIVLKCSQYPIESKVSYQSYQTKNVCLDLARCK